MKTLIMTVGLPRSGKSTWARTVGFPIVCPDAIRLALHGQPYIREADPMVWTVATYMVRALFLAGHDHVILDATNLRAVLRKQWDTPDWITTVKIFSTSATTCKERAIASGQEYLWPVIDRMVQDAELLENAHDLHLRPGWEG